MGLLAHQRGSDGARANGRTQERVEIGLQAAVSRGWIASAKGGRVKGKGEGPGGKVFGTLGQSMAALPQSALAPPPPTIHPPATNQGPATRSPQTRASPVQRCAVAAVPVDPTLPARPRPPKQPSDGRPVRRGCSFGAWTLVASDLAPTIHEARPPPRPPKHRQLIQRGGPSLPQPASRCLRLRLRLPSSSVLKISLVPSFHRRPTLAFPPPQGVLRSGTACSLSVLAASDIPALHAGRTWLCSRQGKRCRTFSSGARQEPGSPLFCLGGRRSVKRLHITIIPAGREVASTQTR